MPWLGAVAAEYLSVVGLVQDCLGEAGGEEIPLRGISYLYNLNVFIKISLSCFHNKGK